MILSLKHGGTRCHVLFFTSAWNSACNAEYQRGLAIAIMFEVGSWSSARTTVSVTVPSLRILGCIILCPRHVPYWCPGAPSGAIVVAGWSTRAPSGTVAMAGEWGAVMDPPSLDVDRRGDTDLGSWGASSCGSATRGGSTIGDGETDPDVASRGWTWMNYNYRIDTKQTMHTLCIRLMLKLKLPMFGAVSETIRWRIIEQRKNRLIKNYISWYVNSAWFHN